MKNKFYLLMLMVIFVPYDAICAEKLAVMDLNPKYGVEKSLAEALSVEIRNEIHRYGDFEVLSREDIETVAKRTALLQSLGCDENFCLINFGQAINTKYIVAGSVTKLGDTYSISLRLLNTEGEDVGVKNRSNEKCKCDEDNLFYLSRAATAQLFGKEPRKVELMEMLSQQPSKNDEKIVDEVMSRSLAKDILRDEINNEKINARNLQALKLGTAVLAVWGVLQVAFPDFVYFNPVNTLGTDLEDWRRMWGAGYAILGCTGYYFADREYDATKQKIDSLEKNLHSKKHSYSFSFLAENRGVGLNYIYRF